MADSIEKKLKKARIKLFRRDIGLVFFGIFGYQFNLSVHEFPEEMQAMAYVQFNPNNLGEVQKTIHLNKEYISRDDFTHDHLIHFICHELLHPLRKCLLRRGQRDPKIWNLASDHCIERDLKKTGLIKAYNDDFHIFKELHKEQPTCSAEQAYDWLIQNKVKYTITMNGDGSVTVKDNKTGEEWTANPLDGDPKDPKIKDALDQLVNYARSTFNNMKDKCLVSGKMAEFLSEILKIKIPWDSLLEKAIKTNTILKPDERSWRQLNKYYQPHGLTLPGYSMMEDNDGVGTLIVHTDTSGSISTEDLQKFSSVIVQSMKYFKTIKLIVSDVDIQQEKDFTQENVREFYQFIKTEGFKGRGGTSHKPVFDRIEELWKDNDFKNDLSMVISLTDGYSDIEHIYRDYRWIINNTPLVFVLTPKHNDIKCEGFDNISNIVINDD